MAAVPPPELARDLDEMIADLIATDLADWFRAARKACRSY
jgi:hypothetical protein